MVTFAACHVALRVPPGPEPEPILKCVSAEHPNAATVHGGRATARPAEFQALDLELHCSPL